MQCCRRAQRCDFQNNCSVGLTVNRQADRPEQRQRQRQRQQPRIPRGHEAEPVLLLTEALWEAERL